MIITPEIQRSISDELLYDLGGKLDGSRRNILVPNCPFCGHDGFRYGKKLTEHPKLLVVRI